MAETEVSSHKEMANPQEMKVFAVETHGLPEDFVYFPALLLRSGGAKCIHTRKNNGI